MHLRVPASLVSKRLLGIGGFDLFTKREGGHLYPTPVSEILLGKGTVQVGDLRTARGALIRDVRTSLEKHPIDVTLIRELLSAAA